MGFQDRVEAGRRLAEALGHLRGQDVVVLGLPRGGVPVAFQVARALEAPLDVIVVRKVGVPWQPELAMGAVGEEGASIVNPAVVRAAKVRPDRLSAAQAEARQEMQRQLRTLRGERPRVPVAGRTAVVVDDGIATGATARAACRVARAQGAARVVLAVPVAPPDAVADLAECADEVVALLQPADFGAVGRFYDDFTATTDAEVVVLLDTAQRTAASTAAASSEHRGVAVDEEATVDAGTVALPGRLTVPAEPTGVVIFAHGSGSSRHSPRNRYVADVLHGAGLGTLLFDLLTPGEEADRANVFDIELLAGRLLAALGWVRHHLRPAVPVGLFGASTGAAAALWAAAGPESDVAAVVSRGGRPDLAGSRLPLVRAPTLLIVGSLDEAVLELNRAAQAQLRCPNRLAIVPGASHLFAEPGTLPAAATLAASWFTGHLGRGGPPPAQRAPSGEQLPTG